MVLITSLQKARGAPAKDVRHEGGCFRAEAAVALVGWHGQELAHQLRVQQNKAVQEWADM